MNHPHLPRWLVHYHKIGILSRNLNRSPRAVWFAPPRIETLAARSLVSCHPSPTRLARTRHIARNHSTRPICFSRIIPPIRAAPGGHIVARQQHRFLTKSFFGFVSSVPLWGTLLSGWAVAQTSSIPSHFGTWEISPMTPQQVAARATELENHWEEVYEGYFETNLSTVEITGQEIPKTLEKISQATDNQTALIYVAATPSHLQVLAFAPGRSPKGYIVPEAKRELVLETVKNLRAHITNRRQRRNQTYINAARKLHNWIISPLKGYFQGRENNISIDTLLFCMGSGLRSLPLSALHDGEQFLIEQYSLALIPAFNMIDTQPDADSSDSSDRTNVLAMGRSEFEDFTPLPAVPIELETVLTVDWRGKSFLNQGFTLNKLRSQLQNSVNIVHLATHARFETGELKDSFIQLWDTQLTPPELRQLPFAEFAINLLVLSACQTALGGGNAELGFAGLAVNSGVQTAVASIWQVSDAGTLALMGKFYQHLQDHSLKAEALRQAQLDLLNQAVRLENGSLRGVRGAVALPPELKNLPNENLSHPYYWASFVTIGAPW